MFNNIFNFCDCCNLACTFKRRGLIQGSGFPLLVSSSLFSPWTLPSAPLGLSSARRAARRSGVCRAVRRSQGRSLCFSSDKTLYLLRIWDLQIMCLCRKLQELVINPIIAVDSAAAKASRNKNCGWAFVSCVERALYYSGISYVKIGSVASQWFGTGAHFTLFGKSFKMQ